MADILTSIHGNLLGLDKDGNLVGKGGQLIGPNMQTAGKTFYVSSVTGNAQGTGGSPQSPVTTIAAALALCTANQGDTIVLLPKHAETITAAGGIAIAKAGVALIGAGTGNQRPTLTYTTANTATLTVTAADVYMENILFIGNFLSIATAIDVTGINFRAYKLSFRDTDSTHGFLRAIKATGTANTADGLHVESCGRMGLSTSAAEMIGLVDNVDRLTLLDNISLAVAGTAACFLLSAGSKIVTAANIGKNKIQTGGTSGNLFISNGGSTNTGLVYENYCGNLDVTGAQTFGAATGLQFFNNQDTSTSTEAGALAQAADTPLS